MKFKETELLKFDTGVQKYEERTSVVEFSPCMINDELYNIPTKLYSKVSILRQIHMYYRSDEYRVIITQEWNDYPRSLIESSGTCCDYYEHDQLCIPLEFSIMGNEDIRISLYKVGEATPIKIDKFKPGIYCGNNITFGYDFILKSGDYFLLFDSVEVNIEEFSRYESLIEYDNKKELFKWYGSESFRKPFYIENGMLVLPFHIYK